ncbi:MAG: YMGG-like glycine zipper-containing protein [Aeoliella sp.]
MAIASTRLLSSLIGLILLTAPAIAQQQYYYQPNPGYYHNDTREGTFVGGGLGAITGALIGGDKNWEGGALIGAGIGALTGRAMGNARDQADAQRVAVGSSYAAQANAQAAANAVTNYDLVQMTNARLSDDLIVSTIQSRGGRFDTSPNGLIALKQAGVSDRVVLAAQQQAGVSGPRPINPTVRVAAPPAVYVRPTPVYHYYHHPHHYHRGHHRHHGFHFDW